MLNLLKKFRLSYLSLTDFIGILEKLTNIFEQHYHLKEDVFFSKDLQRIKEKLEATKTVAQNNYNYVTVLFIELHSLIENLQEQPIEKTTEQIIEEEIAVPSKTKDTGS